MTRGKKTDPKLLAEAVALAQASGDWCAAADACGLARSTLYEARRRIEPAAVKKNSTIEQLIENAVTKVVRTELEPVLTELADVRHILQTILQKGPASVRRLSREEEVAHYVVPTRGVNKWQSAINEWLKLRVPDTDPVVTIAQVLGDCLGIDKGKWDQRVKTRVAKCLQLAGWTRVRRRIEGRRIWVYVPAPVRPKKKRGRGGRPPVDPAKVNAALDLVNTGLSVAKAAEQADVSVRVVYRALKTEAKAPNDWAVFVDGWLTRQIRQGSEMVVIPDIVTALKARWSLAPSTRLIRQCLKRAGWGLYRVPAYDGNRGNWVYVPPVTLVRIGAWPALIDNWIKRAKGDVTHEAIVESALSIGKDDRVRPSTNLVRKCLRSAGWGTRMRRGRDIYVHPLEQAKTG